ncbi:MAG: flagellin [Opitutae bacterium]|nr:flagellin [Opitutae bacterium]
MTSLGNEKFNGKSLFSSTSQAIQTTAEGGTVSIDGVELLSSGSGATTNFSFNGASDNTTFTPSSAGTITVGSGGLFLQDSNNAGNHIWLDNVGDTATYDGAGGWTFSGGGVNGLQGSFASGVTALYMEGSINHAFVGTGSFAAGGASNTSVGDVAAATDLGSLTLGAVTDAIAEIATHRATNGAQQSRLQFADEVVRVNKANIEAANSRITDVDVAEESTTLARYNILVQSGTAMLTQANQSAQMALRLLG